jgi:ketosteroid isomerase-like protein
MKMLFALAAMVIAAPALADPAVEAPIRAMAAAFNTGDVAAAKATHVAAPSILDEVTAPFIWTGPTAFDDWIATLGRSETERGRTGGHVTFGPATRETVDGDRAYVILPSRYTFQQRGRAMQETGTITFALTRQDAAWKIAAWAWTSPEAAAVK